ncbi:hypothetical protein V5N11_003265 [Cardamine amara subsp. amara]|uniref:Cystatin domain-containing protein n=1 Tax=Cardamine amara subsp. amara TaxID=228776 RepID=A0ABD1BTQ1_CARAN
MDTDPTQSQDATEFDSQPLKKPKTESKVEEESKKILIRLEQTNDPECTRQRELFSKQFDDSEGYDVDWDSFDYMFDGIYNLDWVGPLGIRWTNQELIEMLIQKAIEEHDQLHGTQLKFDKYVKANLVPCKGLLYYITFWATDLSSSLPNPEPKLYQTQVWKFADEISVEMVRLRLIQSLS